MKELKQKIEKLEEEKQKIVVSNKQELVKIQELEELLKNAEIKFNVEKQKQEAIENYIHRIEKTVDKFKQEKENIEQQRKELETKIEENSLQEKEIEEMNSTLKKEISEFSDANKDTQTKVDELNEEITNLKISVTSFDESEVSVEEIANMIKNEITSSNENIEIKEKNIIKADEEIKELYSKIEQGAQEIEKIKFEVTNSGSNIEKLKLDRVKANERLAKKEEEQTKQFEIIEGLKAQLVKLDMRKSKLDEDLQEKINKLWDEYELTPNSANEFKKPDNVSLIQKKVNNLHSEIKQIGEVNVNSIEEYNNLRKRYDFMCEQRLDLENTMNKLNKIIQDITGTMKQQFKEKFAIINKNFNEVFSQLFGGGKASVSLEDENNVLECGINIFVQPPGKKLQNMLSLSGGERAFTAIALLFAILKLNPSPFCVLDEIEAALDDVNIYRYAEFLKQFANNTQFLIITHRKGSMEAADTVYGVTMEEHGISKLLSMKLK